MNSGMQIFKFMRHKCKLFFPSSLPHPPTPGNPMRACSQTDVKLACVAGVRKRRGKGISERDHAQGRREEENACKKAIVFTIPPNN